MKKIDIFSSIEGRKTLKDLFYELKYEKQHNSFYVILVLWKICTVDKEINKYSSLDIKIEHNLGFFRGTWLWMEEIINRYFFSTINSFVYFGAAILLVLIGLRRFSEILTDEFVIAGVIFEAAMLMMMFVVMLFTPDEDLLLNKSDNDDESTVIVNEIGEIARDFAAITVQLEELTLKYTDMIYLQKKMIEQTDELINNVAMSVSPNKNMLEAMKENSQQIDSLSRSFLGLNQTLNKLKNEEIEITVRKELERIMMGRIIDDK